MFARIRNQFPTRSRARVGVEPEPPAVNASATPGSNAATQPAIPAPSGQMAFGHTVPGPVMPLSTPVSAPEAAAIGWERSPSHSNNNLLRCTALPLVITFVGIADVLKSRATGHSYFKVIVACTSHQQLQQYLGALNAYMPMRLLGLDLRHGRLPGIDRRINALVIAENLLKTELCLRAKSFDIGHAVRQLSNAVEQVKQGGYRSNALEELTLDLWFYHQYPEALEVLEWNKDSHGDSSGIHRSRSQIMMSTGDSANAVIEARKELEMIAAIDVGDYELLDLTRALLCHAQALEANASMPAHEREAKARDLRQEALETFAQVNDDVSEWEQPLLAMIHYSLGDTGKAEEVFRKEMEARPHRHDDLLIEAAAYLGKWELALILLRHGTPGLTDSPFIDNILHKPLFQVFLRATGHDHDQLSAVMKGFVMPPRPPSLSPKPAVATPGASSAPVIMHFGEESKRWPVPAQLTAASPGAKKFLHETLVNAMTAVELEQWDDIDYKRLGAAIKILGLPDETVVKIDLAAQAASTDRGTALMACLLELHKVMRRQGSQAPAEETKGHGPG